MEKSFDIFLASIFNNPQTIWINIIIGVLIIVQGIIFIKRQSSKGKTAGGFCLLIGFLAITLNAMKLM